MKYYLKINVDSNENNSRIYIKTEHIPVVEDEGKVFNIVKNPYTPKMGHKLFFLPGVNIPRVKLKDFILNYNIKTVRNYDEAHVLFGSKHSVNKVLKSEWLNTNSVENFKNCFEALVTLGRLDTKTVESVKDALEFYTENIILGDWSSFSKIGDDSIYKNLIINPGIKFSAERNSKLFYIVNEDYLDLVPALSGVEILDESAIISQLNGDDSVIITKEVHAQLENMLNSSDADNHIVAMEIIANCRYKESLFYILKLMSDFHQKMQNSPTINHVNFKSLLSYLDKTKYNINFSMDDKINKLIEKDVLTPGMLNALIKEEVSKEGHHFYSSTLKVKSITGGEEVLKYLNTNYVFKLTEDFTPEEKIVEEPDNSSAAEEFPNWL